MRPGHQGAGRRLFAYFAVAAACCFGPGCSASPEVPEPGAAVDAGSLFADVVISFTQAGTPQICSDGLPPCDGSTLEPCGAEQALGPPDDQTFSLDPGGRIDLGFRCTPATERGGVDSPDLMIWATLVQGASGVIEVSEDGTNYETWVQLTESDQEADLATIDRTYVRFLRISNTGTAPIALDAIEAIR